METLTLPRRSFCTPKRNINAVATLRSVSRLASHRKAEMIDPVKENKFSKESLDPILNPPDWHDTRELRGLTSGSVHYTINIIAGRNLPAKDLNGFSDPYCVLFVSKATGSTLASPITSPTEQYRTKTLKKNLSPDWNEQVEFLAKTDDVLYFMVWDWDRIGSDNFIGKAQLTRALWEKGQISKQGWAESELNLSLEIPILDAGMPCGTLVLRVLAVVGGAVPKQAEPLLREYEEYLRERAGSDGRINAQRWRELVVPEETARASSGIMRDVRRRLAALHPRQCLLEGNLEFYPFPDTHYIQYGVLMLAPIEGETGSITTSFEGCFQPIEDSRLALSVPSVLDGSSIYRMYLYLAKYKNVSWCCSPTFKSGVLALDSDVIFVHMTMSNPKNGGGGATYWGLLSPPQQDPFQFTMRGLMQRYGDHGNPIYGDGKTFGFWRLTMIESNC